MVEEGLGVEGWWLWWWRDREGREQKKNRLDEIPLSAPNQYAKYLAGNQIAIMFSFPRRRICLMKRRQIRPAERVCRSR